MYRTNNSKEAVRELQRILYTLSENYYDFPHITIDGIFDENTEKAVRIIQREYKLSETGIVNKDTLDSIYAEYIKFKNIKRNNDIALELFPLKLGDNGTHVSVINAILRDLSSYYSDITPPYGDFYSYDTESAVMAMESHFNQESVGIITPIMYIRLKDEASARKSFR